ncbi:MAG: carboxypeptidase regulatory-like domain-containing protein [Thermogutta sp.]|nr:carboxypeptidase regulatory-like domain-containing protein [Thermogutta sp.]
MLRVCLGLICAAGLIAAAGCPGGGGAKLNTVKVSGTVTLDGAPLPGATVSFVPKSDGARAAFGTTDENGRFTLTTLNPGDGAMPGSYAVSVTKPVAAAASSAPSQDPRARGGSISPEEAARIKAQAQGGAAATAAAANVVPAKYRSADTSRLTAEVKASGDNTFTFELSSR